MEPPRASIKAIFDDALELTDTAARAAFLDQACAQSPELRRKVEALLQAYTDAGSFLEKPAPHLEATGKHLPYGADFGSAAYGPGPNLNSGEAPGTRIGPYKLLQQIGEGGMGIVWMAEQQEPVRRLVALKIMKAGSGSAQVVARFEAERQALALMDHPNIAKVLDAGTIAARPYFVMELVKGVPITQYCDEQQLTPRQRLELFGDVCRALQHAHQKGIIHRDIKPSNVLVAPYDGKPVVKVIDFGVAKATGQRLTDKTLFTEFGAVFGTLEYMSPEQAELNNQDIDTRSDIYSLGVLLYELLTGTTPLTRQRLHQTAIGELLRLIREEEPPTPSTRLSSAKEALPAISAQRRTNPAQLTKLVRGELDWIVMKALDKDRNRRYDTANSLAQDITRYLNDEPVEACPPSTGYKLRKLARRHRRLLITVSAFAALLILASVISTWLAVWAVMAEGEAKNAQRQAEADRDRARTAEQLAAARLTQAETAERRATQEAATAYAVNTFLQRDLLGQADIAQQPFQGPQTERNANLTVTELLDRAGQAIEGQFQEQPETEALLRLTLGKTYMGVGKYQPALKHLERSVALRTTHLGPMHPSTLVSKHHLAQTFAFLGRYEAAERVYQEVLAARAQSPTTDPVQTCASLNNLALVYLTQGKTEQAEPLFREALAVCLARLGANHPSTLSCKNNLILVKNAQKKYPEAEMLYKELIDQLTATQGADHPHTLTTRFNLGDCYTEQAKYSLAEPVYLEVIRLRTQKQGANHPDTLTTKYHLALLYIRCHRDDRAEALLQEVVEASRHVLGLNHRETYPRIYQLILCHERRGHFSQAEPLHRLLVDYLRKQGPALAPIYLERLNAFGMNLWAQQKYQEAEPLLLETYDMLKRDEARLAPVGKARLTQTLERLVQVYETTGKPDEAAKWRRKLAP